MYPYSQMVSSIVKLFENEKVTVPYWWHPIVSLMSPLYGVTMGRLIGAASSGVLEESERSSASSILCGKVFMRVVPRASDFSAAASSLTISLNCLLTHVRVHAS